MTKILSKKGQGEPLHTLDEKEIQKRLYGHYHREIVPSRESSDFSRTTQSSSQFPFPERAPSISFLTQLRMFVTQFREVVLRTVQKFPWKFAAIVMALLFAAVVVFQFISFSFEKTRTFFRKQNGVVVQKVEEPLTASKLQMVVKGEASEKSELKKVESKAVPVTVVPIQSENAVAQLPKKKFYAVQVCTYQREEDAQKLARELQSLNFPAFYRQFLSSQQRISQYIVFLGKDETYTQANARLSEFRKTKQFLTFEDSFIRSL